MGENTRSSLWQKTKNFARHFVYTNIYVESILSLIKKKENNITAMPTRNNWLLLK